MFLPELVANSDIPTHQYTITGPKLPFSVITSTPGAEDVCTRGGRPQRQPTSIFIYDVFNNGVSDQHHIKSSDSMHSER